MSKYSFNRSYYENRAREAFNGNAARKLDVNESYDDFEEEELYIEPEQREVTIERPRKTRQEKTRVRYRIKFNTFAVFVFTAAIAMLLISAFKLLEVQSDISQTEKMIKAAEAKLNDVCSLNESLSSSLDVEIDRDYIYTVAVAKLGMVYPNQNQVVYYEPVNSGYVRQLSSIPVK